MKILVFGAGVLGSLYAAWLSRAGQDVTILARGRRLADIREHGIILENMVSGRQTATPIRAVDSLDPEDAYDLVMVIMRKNQALQILPTLAVNRNTPAVLFIGNNVAGPGALVKALGEKRVLMGFGGAAGVRDGAVIRYTSDENDTRGPVTIGELDGQLSERLDAIITTFEAAGIPVSVSPDIDAWLKSHAALVNPIAQAIYLAGGDNYQLAQTRDGLILMIRAIREGFVVLTKLGIPILPPKFRFLMRVPEPILIPWLRKLMATEFAEIGMAGHANAARDEFCQLDQEFRVLVRKSGLPTPNLDQLGRYLNPAVPPLTDGSQTIPVDWHTIWVGLGLAGVLSLLTGWLVVRRRGN